MCLGHEFSSCKFANLIPPSAPPPMKIYKKKEKIPQSENQPAKVPNVQDPHPHKEKTIEDASDSATNINANNSKTQSSIDQEKDSCSNINPSSNHSKSPHIIISEKNATTSAERNKPLPSLQLKSKMIIPLLLQTSKHHSSSPSNLKTSTMHPMSPSQRCASNITTPESSSSKSNEHSAVFYDVSPRGPKN